MTAVRYQTNFDIDITFGTNGLAQIDFGARPVEANAALLQVDGSLVLAGHVDNGFSGGGSNLALARLTSSAH